MSAARSVSFDWFMAIAGFWTVCGLYTDLGWHIRHHVDTFFTVQHAVLYSGLAVLFTVAIFGRRRPAYRASLWGIALFAAGGAADLIKHQAFGIEHDFDALVSPTHLALGFGVAIAVCGPVRSVISDIARPRSLLAQLPLLIALAAFVELLHWVTNPFFRFNIERMYETPLPHQLTPDALTLQTLHVYEQGGGLLAVILQGLLLAAPAMYVLRTVRPAPGAFTVLFILANVLIALTNSVSWNEAAGVLAASLVAGVVTDACANLQRSVLAALIPAAYNAAYVLYAVAFLGGIWWDASFVTGAIIEASAFAVFLSFIAGTRDAGAHAA
jgi:hypothetical protein